MGFAYDRTIRFHETDAAGVVYFTNLLTLCHEAYEAAIAEAGINVKRFFSGADGTAVPIVHAEADFFGPLFCGDRIRLTLTPKQLTPHSFQITYVVIPSDSQTDSQKPLAQALTKHMCISTDGASEQRKRRLLTTELIDWIDALCDLSEPDD